MLERITTQLLALIWCTLFLSTNHRASSQGVPGVPDWFAQSTQLCYDWYPDGDAGQCSAPSRTLCAAPNQMTANYRDDTDNRGGGCRMRWGLNSAGAPDWFNANVKLCYRWYPDGNGGQCSGPAGRETCGPINGRTEWYRDDTDKRGGGCQMSWRLQVPYNSPQWLLNTRLCYRWFPDGNGGQCGGGAERSLCAQANEWTKYYRDDTDNRAGGCQMSWGLMI